MPSLGGLKGLESRKGFFHFKDKLHFCEKAESSNNIFRSKKCFEL
jgi:hypothetical protein